MTPFDAIMVQRFDDLYDATPSADLALADVLDGITDGLYASDIRHLRTLFATQGEDAYAAAKLHLPQITFAGTFAPTRAKDHLVQHSEICHADIDHLENLLATKQRLQSDPHVLYCFTSPRGDGLKYGVRIAPVTSDALYKHAWSTLASAHHDAYGITWDPSGKDICRLCFVSWDPACYINPTAAVYPVPAPMVTPPASPRPATRRPTPLPTDTLQRHVARTVETAIQMIEGSGPGQKHFARCRAAYLLGGLVGGGLLSSAEAYAVLEAPVQQTSQHPTRAMHTIAGCLQAGAAKPITQADLEADWEHWQARHPRPRSPFRPLKAHLSRGLRTALRSSL